MDNCKCNEIAWSDLIFGMIIFLIVLFSMEEKLAVVYDQTEWYRVLGITLGGITLAATIGTVASLSRVWILEHLGSVLLVAGILWGIQLVTT